MSDRIVEWLDSLELPPCSCDDDETALCPACARMLAVDRLRAQAPTWTTVRARIAAELADELSKAEADSLDFATKFPGSAGSTGAEARKARITAYRHAVDLARSWTPGVRRG